MSRLDEVHNALNAAEQFIQRATIVTYELELAPMHTNKRTGARYREYRGGPAHAAMKRAALDLAKALPPLQRAIT